MPLVEPEVGIGQIIARYSSAPCTDDSIKAFGTEVRNWFADYYAQGGTLYDKQGAIPWEDLRIRVIRDPPNLVTLSLIRGDGDDD